MWYTVMLASLASLIVAGLIDKEAGHKTRANR